MALTPAAWAQLIHAFLEVNVDQVAKHDTQSNVAMMP